MAKGGRWVALQGTRGREMRRSRTPNGAHTHWRAGCVERMHGRFGKGRMEKDQHWHLASRLLHVAAVFWQLWLARPVVAEHRLPWERPRPAERLTPGRVRRAFGGLLVTLGTPAQAPQPRGKSPGRRPGQRPEPAPCFPVAHRPRSKAA